MTDIQFEKILCQKAFLKVNVLLKIVGLSLDINDEVSGFKYLWYRWAFCLNFLCLLLDVFGQILWLVQTSINGTLNLLELTYMGPCLAICVLGCVKSFFFVKSTTRIRRLVKNFYTLYSEVSNLGPKDKLKTKLYMQSHINFVITAVNTLTVLNGLGIIAFSIGPIILMMSQYNATGNLEFLLPFFIVYPFDPFNIRWWPVAYIHQTWSATLAVFTVLGPDSLLHTSCVLLNVKFFQLKQEIELIFDYKNDVPNMSIKNKLAGIIDDHKQLLRSVDLIESIYSESTLCNILTSSILICFTGFNVMAYENILIIIPFIMFLFMVIGQIFLLCYYGDLIQKSVKVRKQVISTRASLKKKLKEGESLASFLAHSYFTSGELSVAVYNSIWYREKTTVVKDLMIISARAQKPCKLTAFGYADMNIEAFSKIMSTAWSYFAVLLSFHKRN